MAKNKETSEMLSDNEESRSLGSVILGFILASVVSAVLFWMLYVWLLRPMPVDPFYPAFFWKSWWVWLASFVTAIVGHWIVSKFTDYEYEISNVQKLVFQVVSSLCQLVFVMSGIYGWFLLFIPLNINFDQFPWLQLLLTFIFLRLLSFAIALPISLLAAKKTDERGTRWGQWVITTSHRVAYGKQKDKGAKDPKRPREAKN
jgi:hypothetical protein